MFTSTIHDSQRMETTQIFIYWKINKHKVVNPNNGVLFTHKEMKYWSILQNVWTLNICSVWSQTKGVTYGIILLIWNVQNPYEQKTGGWFSRTSKLGFKRFPLGHENILELVEVMVEQYFDCVKWCWIIHIKMMNLCCMNFNAIKNF